MEKIVNENCVGLCCEKFCSIKHVWVHEVELNGIKLLLTFCDEHADKFEKVRLDNMINLTKRIKL